MSTVQNFVWKHRRNNKIFTNLPIGMTEYKHKYKNIMEHYQTRNEFYINTLYKIDSSYLKQMDQWNPDSSMSLFNNWNGDHKMTLKSKREVCEEFNKVMSRYMYCEHRITEMEKNYWNLLLFFMFITLTLVGTLLYNTFHIYNVFEYDDQSLYIGYDNNNTSDVHELLYLN